MKTVCHTIGQSNVPTIVRFAHEMEKTDSHYPWSNKQPKDYVAAYKYFVSRCKGSLDKIYFMWSPAGNKESPNFWPGDDYVDQIGLSVFSLPQWDRDYYGKIRSFEENFGEKYSRVSKYSKAIVIAEMGAEGSNDFKQYWLSQALTNTNKFPLLKTIIYFNSKDVPNAWGKDYKTPNWTIENAYFYKPN